MQPFDTSKGTPIFPGYLAKISSPPSFGTSPFKFVPQFRGLNACACGPVGGCDCNPPGMGGLRGSGGGTASVDYTLDNYGLAGLKGSGGAYIPDYSGAEYGLAGLRASGMDDLGLSGLGQNVSLDQIISNAANWLSGFAQSQLPASAGVPPQYGSAGALTTQLINWVPWIVGGYLVYKLIK